MDDIDPQETVVLTLTLQPHVARYGRMPATPDIGRLFDVKWWKNVLESYDRAYRDPCPVVVKVITENAQRFRAAEIMGQDPGEKPKKSVLKDVKPERNRSAPDIVTESLDSVLRASGEPLKPAEIREALERIGVDYGTRAQLSATFKNNMEARGWERAGDGASTRWTVKR